MLRNCWKRLAKAPKLIRREPKKLRFSLEYKPQMECLETRLTPAANQVTFATIGDFGIASSPYNLQNGILGTPDPEGDVSRLVHSWNPDFILTMGDNNYVFGETMDAPIINTIEAMVGVHEMSPETGQAFLDYIVVLPQFLAIGIPKGNSTSGNATLAFAPGTDLSQLAVGMIVQGSGIQILSSTNPYFTSVTAFDDNADTVTLSLPADQSHANITYHFVDADISLTTFDGLSHIDRNIGRYYSDFIYPYVSSTSTGAFGNGSPTGYNRFFPTAGNHDWADISSNNLFNPAGRAVGLDGVQLDGYMGLFKTPLIEHSPNFKIGYTFNAQSVKTDLTEPFFYSFTAGTTNAGKPLIEFFSFSSDFADHHLNSQGLSGQSALESFSNADTIRSPEGIWLKDAMSKSEALWQIPFFHHAPYSSYGDDAEEGLVGNWMRLPFQQWGADAVMFGHVHGYERLSMTDVAIPSLGIPEGKLPIPYLINGSGGSVLNSVLGPTIVGSQLIYNGDFGAQKVFVDENQISFQFYNRSGSLIDNHTITKPLIAIGADAGAGPNVLVVNPTTGQTVKSFYAYEPNFRGGVRVAMADVNGDGLPELITVPGPGRPAQVRVFNPLTGQPLATLPNGFYPYGTAFRNGLFVAAGNIDGKGSSEIIVGPNFGSQKVKVFTPFGTPLPGFTPFFPYGAGFTGGVRVAAGNTNGTGADEIVTAPGRFNGPVTVFNNLGAVQLVIRNPYPSGFTGGLYIAVGDVNGDGLADIITSQGAAPSSRVKVFNGKDGSLLRSFVPYGTAVTSVTIGVVDLNGDGIADILTGTGLGAKARVRIFNGINFAAMDALFPFGKFTGGVFVSG